MLNLLSRVEIEDYWIEQSAASEGRLNILRRQIAFYRQNLRQTADAEFAAIYLREIVRAQSEVAGLLDGDPPSEGRAANRRGAPRRPLL